MEQRETTPTLHSQSLAFPLGLSLFLHIFLFLFSVRVSCLHPSFPSEPFSVSPFLLSSSTLLYYHTNI